MRLRPYQLDLVDRLRAAFRQHRRVIAVAPTGAGKTVIAAEVIRRVEDAGRRVLILAHRKELLDQMSDKLTQFGVAHGVIKRGHPRADLTQDVQVASVQTLARRIDKLTVPDADGAQVLLPWQRPFDLIVVDECHHTPAGTYGRVLEAYPQARVLGLTATPYRLDGRGLDDCYDHLEVGIHVRDLIEQDYLVPAVTYAPPPPEELARVRTRAGEYATGDAAQILDQAAPIDEIVRNWHQRASDRLTAVFAVTVAHAEHLAEAFRRSGVAAAAVDGDTPDEERDATLAALRRGDIRVVCNVMLLTEGWDLPQIGAVVLARPTKSRALWRQMVGRGMRTAEGKRDCLVLDHAGNAYRFGQPNDNDHYQLKIPKRKKGESGGPTSCKLLICPHCQAICDRGSRACRGCGAVLAIEQRHRDELEMRVFGAEGEREQWQYWIRCLRTCRTPGKAAKMYQIHRGDWPAAWMKVASGTYESIHRQEPSVGLRRFAAAKLAEMEETADYAAAV